MRLFTCVATFIATAVVALAAEPARGVTATEIVIGTITDLSGVTARAECQQVGERAVIASTDSVPSRDGNRPLLAAGRQL
jgi:hypothetical protein